MAGVFDLRGAPVDVELGRRMAIALRHRGPDDIGVHAGAGMSFSHTCLGAVDVRGGKQPMFNEDGVRLRYGELDERADRLARAFAARAVERGDRVAILLENGADAVVAIFAALKAGAAFMPINPTTTPAWLALLLHDARPSALVLPAAKLASLAGVVRDAPSLRLIATVGEGAPRGGIPTAGLHDSKRELVGGER